MKDKDYYKPCSFIDRAGLAVVAPLVRGRSRDSTFYLVEFLCCGTRQVLSHRQITTRSSNARHTCKFCRARGEARKKAEHYLEQPDYGIETPNWPVPPSIAHK